MLDPKDNPKAWENYFKDILRRHYGPSNLKDIPDSYGGDFGIECYSFSGHVFQCYLPEQYSDKKKLTRAQQNKIRTDINKFTIKNVESYKILFEDIKISRWILATPEYLDSEMALYTSAKSSKVRKLCLPYISDDFQIIVHTEKDYKSEVKSLRQDLYQLSLDFSRVDAEQADAWINQKLIFLEKMDIKLPKITSSDKVAQTKSFLVQKYLEFQNLLDHLRTEWPDLYIKIVASIDHRTNYLESRFLTDTAKQPQEVIKNELERLKSDIAEEIPTLKKADLDLITYGVIADWLIRCPLDF